MGTELIPVVGGATGLVKKRSPASYNWTPHSGRGSTGSYERNNQDPKESS